jgi:hypothetical protein
MATGTYFTTAGPTILTGLMMQSETRVRIGTDRLWGSLEVSSAAYVAYMASIGVRDGFSWDLGLLASLSFEHVATMTEPDVANLLTSPVEFLETEEVTIGVGIYQFDPRTFEIALATGTMYTIGNERLFVVGGKCTTDRRPLEIAATNIGCYAPDSPSSVLTALTAIIITVYDAQCTSGLPWSEMLANTINTIELEFSAKQVTTLAAGNRLFSVYMF